MNKEGQTQNERRQWLLAYLSSQAYAYIFAGVFFITRYAEIRALFIIGLIFCGISTMLLLAPLSDKLSGLARQLDTLFRGGLFTASGAILIIDGLLGSLRTEPGKVLFWVLLIWLFLLIITNAIVISKRIGIAKFLIFGSAAFGLFMISVGYHQPVYYVIAIIGLLFSAPMLDSILFKKL